MAQGGGGKVLLWAGVGCGALAVLGICTLTGIGAWAYLRQQEDTRAPAVSFARDTPGEGRTGGSPSAPPGYRTVQGLGWSFGVPQQWLEVSPPPGTRIAVRAPTPIAGFHPNVNLVTEPFHGDTAAYGRAVVTQLQAAPGVQVVEHRDGATGDSGPRVVEAKWPRNVPPTHTLQRYAARSGQGYVLTCSGGLGSFESVRDECDRILDTFELAGGAP